MDNPNYYSIIPAHVRYDKRLKANEKLLYSEITALTNKDGVCWATNNYFANLYDVSIVSVSTWIKNLIDCGYISRELIYKNGSKEILKRYLRILIAPLKENLKTPPHENFKDNTTSTNTTSIISTPLPHGEFRYPEREQSQEINNSAYRCWLKIIKDKEMSFTNDELLAIRLYAEAKPFLQPHDILANLLSLSIWANDGLDIRIALLNSFQTKSIIPAKLPVVHDRQGNRLMHQAIAEKRLRQIESENKQKMGDIEGFSGYSDDCIDDLVCM